MLSKSEAKYIQTLSQKKSRETENRFIIDGAKIVKEALQTGGVLIHTIYALESWLYEQENHLKNIEVKRVTEAELKKISGVKTPNQVLALVEIPKKRLFVFDDQKLCLALDGIQDPGNLGTIIRIADWFGISQIVCSVDCVDCYHPKVVQASMGSIFRVSVHYTNLEQWLHQQKKETDIYAAALRGVPLSQFHQQLKRGIIMIGNESKGIRAPLMLYVKEKITIEGSGRAESLNAAVATGIILSHVQAR